MRYPKYIYLNPFFRLFGTRSEENHIFVVGAPRSGTTLLSNVIANHSEVCSLKSETNIFSWRTCFYLLEGNAGRNSYEFNKLRKQKRNVVELLDEVAKQCKIEYGCSRFLEKTPQHVLHLDYILKYYPNAYVINIVRDPRDAYLSSKANRAVPQKSAINYARYWKKSILARQKHIASKSIIDCKYEDLTNAPAEEFSRIMSALMLHFEPNQILPSNMKKDPRAHKKQFRLLGSAISNERNGLFKTQLSTKEIRDIESTIGDVLFIHGYEPYSENWSPSHNKG